MNAQERTIAPDAMSPGELIWVENRSIHGQLTDRDKSLEAGHTVLDVGRVQNVVSTIT